MPPYLIAPRSKFFLFESRLPFEKGLLSRDANGKSLKLYLFKQIGEKHGSVHNTALIPFVLRIAKTPLSFGHSECNRIDILLELKLT